MGYGCGALVVVDPSWRPCGMDRNVSTYILFIIIINEKKHEASKHMIEIKACTASVTLNHHEHLLPPQRR